MGRPRKHSIADVRQAKKKRETNVRIVCPLSGQVFDGRKVALHYLPALLCQNGALTIWCRNHGARSFISDALIISSLMDEKGDTSNDRS